LLTGWLYDITGSYGLSFYLSGLFIAISGLLLLILPAIQKYQSLRQRYKHHPLNGSAAEAGNAGNVAISKSLSGNTAAISSAVSNGKGPMRSASASSGNNNECALPPHRENQRTFSFLSGWFKRSPKKGQLTSKEAAKINSF